MVAGQMYRVEAIYKEGGGGDYLQVASKLETDPAPPDSLSPIPGQQLGLLADPAGASVTITQQPQNYLAVYRGAEAPQTILDQNFNAAGKLNDVHQVKIAMTNASLFAYVADGKNGLRILQLTSPETMPEYAGFSPRPRPVLIATFKTKGDALAVSKGLDRDRAVDESGNQVSVFGRRGARPFNYEEIIRMLKTNDGQGDWFRVSDVPLRK